jgi:hypothetical protein
VYSGIDRPLRSCKVALREYGTAVPVASGG